MVRQVTADPTPGADPRQLSADDGPVDRWSRAMSGVYVVSRLDRQGKPCFVIRVTTGVYDSGYDCGHMHRSEHAAVRCLRREMKRFAAIVPAP